MAYPEDLVLAFHVTDPDKGLNYWSGIVAEILIAGKFRGIFTVLFGVSSYIMYKKITIKHQRYDSFKIYFYRLIWLLIIGLINAYLFLWWGDVLFKYALLGVLLFAFWRTHYWVLTAAAFACLAILTVQPLAEYRELANLQQKSIHAHNKQQSGQALTPDETNALEEWKEAVEDIKPQIESIEDENKIKTSNFLKVFKFNFHKTID